MLRCIWCNSRLILLGYIFKGVKFWLKYKVMVNNGKYIYKFFVEVGIENIVFFD